MTAIEIMNGRPESGGYKVNVSRGGHNGRVSSEWFSRPDDEKYLSLSDLYASVKGRAARSRTRTVESAAIRMEAHRDDPEKLALVLPDADTPVAPTHWSFGQLASLVGAPAAYLRQLPAPLAGINLQYGLTNHRAEQVKTMEVANGRTELRAVTGPDYGRIYDHELVSAVQRIAGDGVGDTRWKVPGVLDWSTGVYNPMVDVTKDTTTLYASDRDVFLFLVDDRNPIEAGTLPDGSPDLFFRGFYAWNSEVGAKSLGIASFYLRAVCQNRNLWGVEDFQEISIRHSKYAANRFAHEAAPAFASFADSSPQPFIQGIRSARERIVARSDEDRTDFLRKRGFSKAETGKIVETVLAEEGRPPESVFDFVQGITAVARSKPQQDARLTMERRGTRGRYWTRIRSGLIVVSDDELTTERPRAFIVPWSPDWSIRIATAERLRRVWRGQTPRALFTLQRRKRIGHALRTDDARQSGARLRDIAVAYFGARRVAAEPWKTSALKAQVARLAAYGRTLVGDGYRQLLRGKSAARLSRK